MACITLFPSWSPNPSFHLVAPHVGVENRGCLHNSSPLFDTDMWNCGVMPNSLSQRVSANETAKKKTSKFRALIQQSALTYGCVLIKVQSCHTRECHPWSINACLANPHLRHFSLLFCSSHPSISDPYSPCMPSRDPPCPKPTPGFRVRDAYRTIQSKGFNVWITLW